MSKQRKWNLDDVLNRGLYFDDASRQLVQQAVERTESGRTFDIEGDGPVPYLTHVMSDGRTYTEGFVEGLVLGLFDERGQWVGADIELAK